MILLKGLAEYETSEVPANLDLPPTPAPKRFCSLLRTESRSRSDISFVEMTETQKVTYHKSKGSNFKRCHESELEPLLFDDHFYSYKSEFAFASRS